MTSINSTASDETPKLKPSLSLLRRVTIMATGTRGDIQPYVAVGIALKRKGYAIRVLTHPSPTHTKMCADFGLEHVSLGTDADAFMRDDKDARTAMETGDTIKFFGCLADLIKNNTESTCKPFYNEVVADGVNRPDLLIVSFLNRFFGIYARHVLKIPTIEIMLQHWVFDDPSRAPMGMPTLPLGLHKLIHTKLMIPQDYKNFKRFDDCIGDILASEVTVSDSTPMPLPRLEDFLPYDQWYESEVNHSPLLPLLIAQPPMFKEILCPTLPAIPSSPNLLRYVGPAIIETMDQTDGNASSFGSYAAKKKLEVFLASDTERKPIYMGWGSMIRRSTHGMVIYAVEVLQKSQQRGIVLGGLAGLSMELLEEALELSTIDTKERQQILEYAVENIVFVDKAPHEWLFPRVSLTVQHGGAGTLNGMFVQSFFCRLLRSNQCTLHFLVMDLIMMLFPLLCPAALRAGVPTIVTPVFGDQYDNSFVVQKIGVGFGFADKLQSISASDLSKTITDVLNDPNVADRAKQVGAQLRSGSNGNDGGCGAIVKEIETYWRENVVSGNLLADIRNWKTTTKERKNINSEKQTLRTLVALAFAVVAAVVAVVVASQNRIELQN